MSTKDEDEVVDTATDGGEEAATLEAEPPRRRRRRKAEKKKPRTKPTAEDSAFEEARLGFETSTAVASAFASFQMLESKGEKHAHNWAVVEKRLREIIRVDEEKADLMRKLKELEPRRDEYLAKFESVKATSQSVLDDPTLRAASGGNALAAGRKCRNLAKSHDMFRRRLHDLNNQIKVAAGTLVDLEQRHPPIDHAKLDALYQAAKDEDAPKALLEVLDRVTAANKKAKEEITSSVALTQHRQQRDRRGGDDY